jgi:hypothetical protein
MNLFIPKDTLLNPVPPNVYLCNTSKTILGQLPAYDGATPTKPRTAQYTYIFAGWNLEMNQEEGTAEESLPTITGPVTYYAAFSKVVNNYTVRITISPEGYGTVSNDVIYNVPYGTIISANANQLLVNGLTVTATETIADAQYTYSFENWLNNETIISGDTTLEVGDDVLITAKFTRVVNTYTVTWFNDDGSVVHTDIEVPYGTLPVFDGKEPTKDRTAQYTYIFNGWTPEIVPVTGDAEYIAVYDAITNTYTITWKNYDGTVLETDENIEYGKLPTYDGETPRKPRTAQFTFEFSGWDPTVDTVKGDETYTATYIEHLNAYTVT